MTTLQSTELAQAQEFFDKTRKRVAGVTAGLSDAQWRFKPAADRWSIAENLEHMVIVQERILGPVREQLAQAPAPPGGRDFQLIDRIVLEKIPDRSLRAKAPEFIHPPGQSTPQSSLDRLFQNYERLTSYITSTPGLREHELEAPPLRFVTNGAYTTMDGFQWALALAAHDERHVRQILEVQADPNYPRQD